MRSENNALGCLAFLNIIGIILCAILWIYREGYSIHLIIAICIIMAVLSIFTLKNKNREHSKYVEETNQKIHSLSIDLDNKCRIISNKEKEVAELTNDVEYVKSILFSSSPFKKVASLCADLKTIIYAEKEKELKFKSHPAYKAADEVRKLKNNAQMCIEEYKQMLYKYEYLLSIFPELKRYVDDEEALVSLDRSISYDDFKENRDCSQDYLSQEEWNKLSTAERNQLALDRYKTKPKSNWRVGIEYEMYIEYLLRLNGYKTIPFGSLNGLNDLGRDIIAFKTDNQGNNIVYIIQCKNWSTSKNKLIHENVVCQVFGSAMEYQLRHKNEMFMKVLPVIYSTVPLSDMAQTFAKKLGVLYVVKQKGEYPMIKCNISKDGSRIYHLPFDQQYYRTEICKSGEFYAWTVKEAEDKGFRRAFKFNIKNN